MKSIIQDEKECFLTKTTQNLDKHHLFFGNPDRQLSEKYGLWVWIEHTHHIKMSPYKTPHNNRELDLKLKIIGQRAFEKAYPELNFIEIFGKNYDY